MTPKEKAEELYSKFEDNIQGIEGYEWWESAKQCALIAVDEILKLEVNDGYDHNFWQQVKQEIEKL
jgi:hypothetical protein